MSTISRRRFFGFGLGAAAVAGVAPLTLTQVNPSLAKDISALTRDGKKGAKEKAPKQSDDDRDR